MILTGKNDNGQIRDGEVVVWRARGEAGLVLNGFSERSYNVVIVLIRE